MPQLHTRYSDPKPAFQPPWSRVEGKGLVDFQGLLPNSGNVLRGVHFREVPFALVLSQGRSTYPKTETWNPDAGGADAARDGAEPRADRF